MELCTLQLEQLGRKGASEDGITITSYGLRKAVETKDLVEEDLSYLRCRERMLQWYEVCKLGVPIHDHHDDILSMARWQSFYEVHRDVFPHLFGER